MPFVTFAICLLSLKIIDGVEFGVLYKIGWNDEIYLQGEY